jgi:hypothetical protein
MEKAPNPNQIAQGDILFVRVGSLPPKQELRDNGAVIAEGEQTGHAHRLLGGIFWRDIIFGGHFVEALPGGAKVTHEEHGTALLPEGVYEVKKQRYLNRERSGFVQRFIADKD